MGSPQLGQNLHRMRSSPLTRSGLGSSVPHFPHQCCSTLSGFICVILEIISTTSPVLGARRTWPPLFFDFTERRFYGSSGGDRITARTYVKGPTAALRIICLIGPAAGNKTSGNFLAAICSEPLALLWNLACLVVRLISLCGVIAVEYLAARNILCKQQRYSAQFPGSSCFH